MMDFKTNNIIIMTTLKKNKDKRRLTVGIWSIVCMNDVALLPSLWFASKRNDRELRGVFLGRI